MNAKQISQFTFLALASLGAYMFVASARDGELRAACSALCALRPDYVNDDRRVPDFELVGLDGKKVSMRSYRGKTVVLNVWTKTCPPCLEEMPSIAELANIWKGDKDKMVLSIAADMTADDTRATLKAVLGREPPFTVLVDPELAVVGDLFGTKLYPETWLIDPEGVIRARVDTARDWAGSVALDAVAKMGQPGGACPVTFRGGKPEGELRGVCDDFGPNLQARTRGQGSTPPRAPRAGLLGLSSPPMTRPSSPPPRPSTPAPETIDTGRLRIRAFREGDGAALLRLVVANRERLAESFPASVAALTDEASAEAYVRGKRLEWAAHKGYWFAVFEKPGERLVGQVQIKNVDWDVGRGELAYYVDRDFEGVGLVAEAVREMVRLAFDALGLQKLCLRTVVSNVRSQKLAERLGFVREGTLRREFRTSTGTVDVHYYGLLRPGGPPAPGP